MVKKAKSGLNPLCVVCLVVEATKMARRTVFNGLV
jgi:hypothetical protein